MSSVRTLDSLSICSSLVSTVLWWLIIWQHSRHNCCHRNFGKFHKNLATQNLSYVVFQEPQYTISTYKLTQANIVLLLGLLPTSTITKKTSPFELCIIFWDFKWQSQNEFHSQVSLNVSAFSVSHMRRVCNIKNLSSLNTNYNNQNNNLFANQFFE